MKKRAILFILSLLFIVLACGKGDKNAVKAIMPYPTDAPIPNSNIGTGPSVEDWQDESRFVTSGIYTYRVIDESNKTIEIRKINTDEKELVIPSTIDGYKVVNIGYYRKIQENYDEKKLEVLVDSTKIEQLTFPAPVEKICKFAFYKCKNLKKICFPEKPIDLSIYTFYGCEQLEEVRFPDGVTFDDDTFAACGKLKKIYSKGFTAYYADGMVFDKQIDDWYISQGKTNAKDYYTFDGENFCIGENVCTIKRLHVDKDVRCVKISQLITNPKKQKIYINGKKTKLEYSDSDKATIYTVKGAKAITTAKKNKLPYLYKTSKPVKVKNNKWKKVKTTTVTNKYNKKKKKWQETKKNSASIYKVYAKNTKSGKYKLVETTKKNHTKKKYKYVKVKVDLSFE